MNCNCQNNSSQTCGCDCGCATVPDTSGCCCGCGCNNTCDCNCNCNCNNSCNCNCGCDCNCCDSCGCSCNCCNSSCNLLYKCNCLKKYIASLTQRINEYSAYLEANPCDKLAACLVCEAKQELAAEMCIRDRIGTGSLISRRLGEKRREAASLAAENGLFLAALSYLLFALLGLFGTETFIRAFASSEIVAEYSCTYTYIVTIGSFGLFLSSCLEKTLQATGNMIFPMLIQLTGAVTVSYTHL